MMIGCCYPISWLPWIRDALTTTVIATPTNDNPILPSYGLDCPSFKPSWWSSGAIGSGTVGETGEECDAENTQIKFHIQTIHFLLNMCPSSNWNSKAPYQESEPNRNAAFRVFPTQHLFPSDPDISPERKQWDIRKASVKEWPWGRRSKTGTRLLIRCPKGHNKGKAPVILNMSISYIELPHTLLHWLQKEHYA